MQQYTLHIYRGAEILPILDAIGNIRIAMFREFPYLYDGSLAYEREYLMRYTEVKDSFVLVAEFDDHIIGVATGMPLFHELDDIKNPFETFGLEIEKIFYIGEVIVLPAHRGKGLDRIANPIMQDLAKNSGYEKLAFITVVRPENHPLKPKNYRHLDALWYRYGFMAYSEIFPQFKWKDIDQSGETYKVFRAWIKNL